MADVISPPIGVLGLGGRARNCLVRANIVFVGDLVRKSDFDLLKLPNLGRSTLEEIKMMLDERGLSLGMSEDDIDSAEETQRVSQPPVNASARHSTFKGELIEIICRLLVGRSIIDCFIAYHGLEDDRGLPMDNVAQEMSRLGHRMSKESVRQTIDRARRTLFKESERVRFRCWDPAVERAQDALPMPLHSFLSCFGYKSAVTALGLFETLEYCAAIFRLNFPFEVQRRQQCEDLVLSRSTQSRPKGELALGELRKPRPWARTSFSNSR